MNSLDLAKVGKAFGFSVPPRVNVNIGSSQGTTPKSGRKRPRDDEIDEAEGVEEEADAVEGGVVVGGRSDRRGKERRIAMVGRKNVDKEVYRKGKPGGQWSR